ncbi:hypothetical protein GCM10010372_31120 [Streptomyces tauricus]|nr:hypothetical protein GCM10010372_31120 [Streptomyces tauricus]
MRVTGPLGDLGKVRDGYQLPGCFKVGAPFLPDPRKRSGAFSVICQRVFQLMCEDASFLHLAESGGDDDALAVATPGSPRITQPRPDDDDPEIVQDRGWRVVDTGG